MQRTLMFLAVGAVCVAAGVGGCGTEGESYTDPPFDPNGEAGATSSGGIVGSSGGSDGSSEGGASGGPACATGRGEAIRQPVYLSIVLDGSGSMDGALPGVTGLPAGSREPDPLAPGRTYKVCAHNRGTHGQSGNNCPADVGLTGKKWLAVRGALKAYFDAEGAIASPRLGVGLRGFETSKGTVNEDLALLDAAHAERLWALLDPDEDVWPNGTTPMRTHVLDRVDFLRAFVPQAPLVADGRKVILLITDGVPSANGDLAARQREMRELVEGSLADDAIATAVIGVGNPTAAEDDYNETFLSDLANRGGVAAAGCDPAWNQSSPATSRPCHLQITPGEKPASELQSEISEAIDAIASSLISCTLTLDRSADIDPAKVNVVYVAGDGSQSQVPAGADNGWTFDDPADPAAVQLNGAACAQLKADPAGRIDIVVGCPTGDSVVN